MELFLKSEIRSQKSELTPNLLDGNDPTDKETLDKTSDFIFLTSDFKKTSDFSQITPFSITNYV